MPALIAYRNDTARFAHTVRVAVVYLLFFQVTSGLFLFFNAGHLVGFFLGSQWGAAVPLLRILCFVPFLDVFTEIGGEVLRARSEDRLWLGVTLLNLVSLVAVGVVFTHRWGAVGMAWANLLLVGHVVMGWRMARLFTGHLRDFAIDMLLLYLVPVATFGLAAFACAPGWGRVGASAAAGLAAATLLVPRFKPLFARFLSERGWIADSETLTGAEGLREPNPGRAEELL
jgi:O-antigen/teichoic acid export membrane protein